MKKLSSMLNLVDDCIRREVRSHVGCFGDGIKSMTGIGSPVKSIKSMAGNSLSCGSSEKKWLGKSFSQWNSEWIYIGSLKDADLSSYNHCVGLYRHVVNGKTAYVGRAIELYNGGFRKRLSDYRRKSNSARTHTSGSTINDNLDNIRTYLLIVGDTPEAVDATIRMEPDFIRFYSPAWNKQHNG